MQKKFRKQLPQMKPEIFSCINNNLQIIMKIIEEIENEIQLIELAQKLQITFFTKQNLVTSHEEIENINKINQTINQVAKELQELSTITPYAAPPPKNQKSFLSNYSKIIATLPRNTNPTPQSPHIDKIRSYSTIPSKQVTIRSASCSLTNQRPQTSTKSSAITQNSKIINQETIQNSMNRN